MRIGLMIDPIDPKASYFDNLKKSAELGFQVVQLWYKDVVSNIREKPETFIEILEGLGLELKSLAAYTDILDPHRVWDEIFQELQESIYYAAEAGVKYVVTESGGIPGNLDEWDKLITRFLELVECAESCGVTLLVENGPGVLVRNTKLMLKMMEDLNSDYVGINFDPGNLNLVPDDIISAVQRLGNYIKDTHAKDSILLTEDSEKTVPKEHIFEVPEGEEFIHIPEGVKWALPPIGEGEVCFSEYISELNKIGFSGDLIIEYQGGGNRREAIVRSKGFLENLIRSNP